MTEDHHDTPRRIAILGAPVELGASEPGAAMGPAALRTAGLVRLLRDLGHAVEDHGDVDPLAAGDDAPGGSGALRNGDAISAWSRALSRQAFDLMQDDATPVFLGGDHSLSIGTVNGVARHAERAGRELIVLWLDAHADFNTPITSPSGNLHGMPVAALCGEPGLEDLFGDEPRVMLEPSSIYLFGIRSVDRDERDLLHRRGVNVFDMRRIDEMGVARLIAQVIDAVVERDAMLHVSLDVDFLDPSVAPGVGTTVPGGATYREAHLAMEMLHDSGRVTSVDVAELNPFLDERGKSAHALADLTASLFGRRISHGAARDRRWAAAE